MPAVAIQLPDDGDEFELLAQFPAYSRGCTIDPTSGEPKMPLGIPFPAKYEAMRITDRPGEILHFVVFARVAKDHYGEATDESDAGSDRD